ncbi:DUF1833 family protein [Acinetobacter gerneri]|uniref:DUF1833 family protein n=1 Tax=Acinetobacter gerneri TaxID=202952 RepID=UPI0029353C2C|nr:DUF1833 family protein [Acinetobacter gerneri]MDV2440704.1 DUF1833 family protein [Acinetobacter gerneri]
MSLTEFHLDSSPSVVLLECIEVKHSLWAEPLRYVTNNANGMTVKHEDGELATYQYMPVQIDKGSTTDDLDQSLKITVSDLGEIVPKLLDLIAESGIDEDPEVIYRSYMSTDLENPVSVINGLELNNTSSDAYATTFDASARKLNSTGTGRVYTVDEFPSLRAFF